MPSHGLNLSYGVDIIQNRSDVSMPSHGLNLSANMHKNYSSQRTISLHIPTILQNSPSVNHLSPNFTIFSRFPCTSL